MSATTGAAVGFDACALRSLLFVPALSPHLAERAHERGADALIVDLEDSIAPAMKQQARDALGTAVRAIAAHGLPVFVRVLNDPALLQSLAAAPKPQDQGGG